MNTFFCTLCPRACGANRETGAGLCGASKNMKVARAALHFWEEPCISGKNGSGTVFFSGCPLRCVFCQNEKISREGYGKEISGQRLVEICFALKAQGAHNINLVTPMHFAPMIREALLPVKKDLGLPIVVNTGGYDSPEQLAAFDGLADIYLPDCKYFSPELARQYSSAPDYPEVCFLALSEMYRQVGPPVFDGAGLLKRGMIVRHLILPGQRADSIAVLHALAAMFRPGQILLSLMSQFSPRLGAVGDLARRITTFERDTVVDTARSLGFEGYFQDRASACDEFIPEFDLTGV